MTELNHFRNDGFGWICRDCERALKSEKEDSPATSRLLREGEAESRQPTFSGRALAKWTDAARRVLMCPRCGVTESAD